MKLLLLKYISIGQIKTVIQLFIMSLHYISLSKLTHGSWNTARNKQWKNITSHTSLLLIINHSYLRFIHNSFTFPVHSQLEHRTPFGISVITHTIRHTVGLLWTSEQPVAETSTYTRQHNIQPQETNIHAPSRIRTRDPSNQAAADVRLGPATGIGYLRLKLGYKN
jgi:hypothetical protein